MNCIWVPIKKDCHYAPCCIPPQLLHKDCNENELYPPWGEHPSWITGAEQLLAYNRWVNTVVLPIAFQWVEENKEEVLRHVPRENWDDVGEVIAAAFKLVKEKPYYKENDSVCSDVKQKLEEGKFDPNPVWASITTKIRKCIRDAFPKPHGEGEPPSK